VPAWAAWLHRAGLPNCLNCKQHPRGTLAPTPQAHADVRRRQGVETARSNLNACRTQNRAAADAMFRQSIRPLMLKHIDETVGMIHGLSWRDGGRCLPNETIAYTFPSATDLAGL
jgi:hypothetical protein